LRQVFVCALAVCQRVVTPISALKLPTQFNRVGKNNARTGRTLLKFSLATLPPGTTANDVKQARLVLWVNNSTANLGSITMTPVTSAWDELVLKNSNSFGLTFGSPKIFNLPVAAAANFLSIDVTDWAKAWLNGTLANEGFQIEPGASMTLLEKLSLEAGGGCESSCRTSRRGGSISARAWR
jgi:hypothetical protein